jgi:hypothetical protein
MRILPLITALLVLPWDVTSAATIIVNHHTMTEADDGFCTINEAIGAANNNMSSGTMAGECAAGQAWLDEVVFALPAGVDTIVKGPTDSIPSVLEPLKIVGPGADLLTIDALQIGHLFTTRADLELSGLKLSNGEGFGGNAIAQLTAHDLILSDCVFDGHSASNGGGAIRVRANDMGNVFSVTDCDFINNDAQLPGGAIQIAASDQQQLMVVMQRVRFFDNTSEDDGGALSVRADDASSIWLDLQSVRFEANQSEIHGGGLFIEGQGVTGQISSTSFFANEARFGGALAWMRTGHFMAVNNTFHQNMASSYAAAIFSWAEVSANAIITLANNTITENVITTQDSSIGGAGIYSKNINTLISHNVLAQNNSPQAFHDCSGSVNSLGYNFIGDGTGCGIINGDEDLVGDDQKPLLPNLSPLVNDDLHIYQVPLDESPLLDAGNPMGCDSGLTQPIYYDQIGQIRHQDGSSSGLNRCDIGAIEVANPDVIFHAIFE